MVGAEGAANPHPHSQQRHFIAVPSLSPRTLADLDIEIAGVLLEI